ncbi:ATP phosphoribosyltransferase [Anaeromicrobium sediminis]|uniref:ATP phosphoribosyltransferase n=1 Tax=Anaeromicrobium sediminis TaxID=1478221 RepID=A0A267MLC0_9FIRM|nr:ATP phosphoribosyltransferase [Anaeromicrobium sediminis]PAB59708.1 ATP phosphoribosyltransferase [Anaeromicrobium sediminis]
MAVVRVALTKGRLEKESIKIFKSIGINSKELENKGRKIIFKSDDNTLEFILVKAKDVLTYVEHGAADMGIVGKDTILEETRDFYEVLDLKVGKCRFALASTPEFKLDGSYRRKKIATKYPNVARKYFVDRGEDVEIIRIEGSVEIAPILGLTDAVVDIVETGRTLKENGLIIVDEICDVSARMIVNKASMKMKKEHISSIIRRLEDYLNNYGEEALA